MATVILTFTLHQIHPSVCFFFKSAFYLPLTFKILAYMFLFLVLYLQVIFNIQLNQCVRTRPTPHHWVAHAHARHHG